jgi:Xaa-Pro aminopeptidase
MAAKPMSDRIRAPVASLLALVACLAACGSPSTLAPGEVKAASDSLAGLPDEDPPAPLHALSRPGDGQPVCGLGKAFHAGRRALLRERLGSSGFVLLRGLPETRDYTEFRQDKVFWYLTGIESPGATLLMDLTSGLELLFLPHGNPSKEFWEGELWDSADEWVADLTGIERLLPEDALSDTLLDMLSEDDVVWISRHPFVGLAGGYDRAQPADLKRRSDPLDGRLSREAALADRLEETYGVEVKDLSSKLHEMRRVKTSEEIAALKRAGVSGARAMAEAMRSTAPGVGEWEIDGLIGFVQQREGADGMAYHAIVGSGPNSCVLHYSASSRRMQDGEVLLIDAGSEVDHYTTDITRTWPVGGRFSERQAELYDAVLAAQAAGIAAVRPGATMIEVDAAANGVLRELGFGSLIRHGVSHYVGLEVHDVGRYGAPFVPGVVFTVEPGIYEEETQIGIRIEDVVVVTEDGCEVITRDVPVARLAVEQLVAAPGLLDSLGGS